MLMPLAKGKTMVEEIILPKLGQTMEEGTIIEWLKEEGDLVEQGEVIFTMESDKATLTVEAKQKGFLRKILVPAGETVPVLTIVALLTETRHESLSNYEIRDGVTSPLETMLEPRTEPAAEKPRAPSRMKERERGRVFASPRARRRARDEGVDLTDLTGTGPGGRITEEDVLKHLAGQPEATPVAQRLADHAGINLAELDGSGFDGRITKADVELAIGARESISEPRSGQPAPAEVVNEVPMRGVRARIAQRMRDSHQITAPVTLTTEADATNLVEARQRLNTRLADELGFRIGYNDLLVRLVGCALGAFPYMNARLQHRDDEGEALIQHLKQVNVAVAVDTERGLLVPVIEKADQKSLTEIARELQELVERARAGQALPCELSGSTFTITNLGMHEIDAFTPIINLPEAAILGVGRIKERPAVVKGTLCIRHQVWLSLTFDHRLVDGAPAARFLQHVRTLIEEPVLLLA
jgi:pyruvate dehydrogenase E2 component (dihydrolipoamide acetyltransferase)